MANAVVKYAQSVAATTATTTTWVDLASLAATEFEANKTYLILANQVCVHDNQTNHTRVRLVHGTTPTAFDDASCSWEGQGQGVSTQHHEISYMFFYTQPGTAELVKLQISSNTTGSTITNSLSQIIAIKLSDDFTENTHYFKTEDLVNYTLTATPTAKATTGSFTPNGTDRWLFIGNMVEDVVTLVDEIGFELYDSVAGVLGKCWQEGEDTADQRAQSVFWAGVPTNAARTLSIRPVEEAGSNIMLAGRTIALNLTTMFAERASAFSAGPTALGTSPTYSTLATIAPNPTNTGNWVVIAFATLDTVYTSDTAQARLQINPDGGGLVDNPAFSSAAPGTPGWDLLDTVPFSVFNLLSLTSGGARTMNYDFKRTSSSLRAKDIGIVAFSVAKPASGQTVAMNQVTETDTAQATAKQKIKAFLQSLETDLAQAFTRVKRYAFAQNVETDTAQAIARVKIKAMAQVVETDLAQIITVVGPIIVPVGQVLETDLAQAVAKRKIKAAAQVLETDLAQAIAKTKIKAAAQVIETDLAQAVARTKIKAAAQVLETDLAQAVARTKIKAAAQALESDAAQAVAKRKIKAAAQALEIDAAQSIQRLTGTLIQQVEETDLAQALFPLKRVAVAQAFEIDLAQVFGIPKIKAMGQAGETDLAQSMLFAGIVALGIARLSDGLVDVASLSNANLWSADLNDSAMDVAGLSNANLWSADLNDLAYESAVVEDDPL